MTSRHAIHARAQQHHGFDQREHHLTESRDIFITTKAAGEMVSKSPAAFRMWAKRRGIEVVKDGRHWLVSRIDILATLKRRTVKA